MFVIYLDIHDPTSLLDMSIDGYHSYEKNVQDKHKQGERRKRVAELVNQLKLTDSIGSTSKLPSSSNSNNVQKHTLSTRLIRSTSPIPAPDSVPAAVAHAVVQSLKRRQETAGMHASVKFSLFILFMLSSSLLLLV